MCGQKGKAEVSEMKSKFFSLTTPYTHMNPSYRGKGKLLTTTFLRNGQLGGKNQQNDLRSKSYIPEAEINFSPK